MVAHANNSNGNASSSAELLLLPEIIRNNSPSQQDGIDKKIETLHRFFGCELIQEAGQSMKLPQVVMVTAQSILHRFLYRKSLTEFDAFRSAMGSLFLACKIEEQAKSMRELITVFYAIFRIRKCCKTRNRGHSIRQRLLLTDTAHGSFIYGQWSEWLICVERQILIDLGFSIYKLMESHPHKYILYYVKMLNGSNQLAQSAWNFVNDSLRIDLCTRVDAQVIACSAIFLASRQENVVLPISPPWYQLFDVSWKDISEVALEIAGVYKLEKNVWLEPLTPSNPFEYEMDEDNQPEHEIQVTSSGTEGTTGDQVEQDKPSTVEAKEGDHQQQNECRHSRNGDTLEPTSTGCHLASGSPGREKSQLQGLKQRPTSRFSSRSRSDSSSHRRPTRRSRSKSSERRTRRRSHRSRTPSSSRSRSNSRGRGRGRSDRRRYRSRSRSSPRQRGRDRDRRRRRSRSTSSRRSNRRR